MAPSNDYKAVDCGFHDRIEAAIVTHQRGKIRFTDEKGSLFELDDAKIVDWVNRDGAEYVVLHTAQEIRMDRIQHFMGIDILGGYCIA